MVAADDLKRASWHCIHFVDGSGVDVILTQLTSSGISTLKVDASNVSNEKELLKEIAAAMHFPDYFGANWDAFAECICDLEWLAAGGYVLIVENSTCLWKAIPRAAGKLLEAWLFAADQWAQEGVPFHLVFSW